MSTKGFVATLLGTIIAAGGVGWGTARTVLKDVTTQQHLEDIKQGAQAAKQLMEGNNVLPAGAVLAVASGNHVNDIPEICPDGWDVFTEATGRVLVGAGDKTDTTSIRHPMTSGGSEVTPHTEPAAHQHNLFADSGAAAKRYPNAGEAVAMSANVRDGGLANENFEYQMRPGGNKPQRGASSMVGSSDPLANMQPFIAVTFCVKR